jgi:beta-lactam-binding protein with PASTA domain
MASAPAPVPTATGTNPAPTTEPPPTSAPPEEKPYVVPWVLGQTETIAKDMIVSAGLTPEVHYVVISDGDCRVLSQTPSGGTPVPAGSAVEIELPKPTGQCPILSERTQ